MKALRPLVILVLCVAASYLAMQLVRHLRHPAMPSGPARPSAAVIAADPLGGIGRIIAPTLVIYGTADRLVRPDENALPAIRALGRHASVVVIPGADHGDPRLMDVPACVAFVRAHAPIGTPVILLHGYGRLGRSWFGDDGLPAEDTAGPARISLTSQLAKAGYPCRAGDLKGNAWGNDAALSDLERMTAQEPRVVLIGESMGGMLLWRYAERHPQKVTALVAIKPVCSLPSMCRTSLGQSVAAAYR